MLRPPEQYRRGYGACPNTRCDRWVPVRISTPLADDPAAAEWQISPGALAKFCPSCDAPLPEHLSPDRFRGTGEDLPDGATVPVPGATEETYRDVQHVFRELAAMLYLGDVYTAEDLIGALPRGLAEDVKTVAELAAQLGRRRLGYGPVCGSPQTGAAPRTNSTKVNEGGSPPNRLINP